MAELYTRFSITKLQLLKDQDDYRFWRKRALIAFRERGWEPYLKPKPSTAQTKEPAASTSSNVEPEFEWDAETDFRAQAFLIESLPNDILASVEHCDSALEIWETLQVLFGSKTEQDLLRERQLFYAISPEPDETLDKYITRFTNRVSSLKAQLTAAMQMSNSDVITTFNLSLERWTLLNGTRPFSAYGAWLGRDNRQTTPEVAYADAKTYYNAYVKPNLRPVDESISAKAISTKTSDASDATANWTKTGQHNDQSGNRGGKSNRGRRRGYNNQDKNATNNSGSSPFNPDAYCTYHNAPGHTAAECKKKKRDEAQADKQPDGSSNGNGKPEMPRAPARACIVRSFKVTASESKPFIFDSCCTEAMVGSPKFFHVFNAFDKPSNVYGVENSTPLTAYGKGVIRLQDLTSGTIHEFPDVWYVPGLSQHIIPKHYVRKHGIQITLDENDSFILAAVRSSFKVRTSVVNSIETILNVKAVEYDPSAPPPAASNPTPSSSQAVAYRTVVSGKPHNSQVAWLMHIRLGHSGREVLSLMGIAYHPGNCEPCDLGKATRLPFPEIEEYTDIKLFRVYSDVCGPISPPSVHGHRYFVIFVDEATRYCWVFCIHDKSSDTVFRCFERFKNLAENQANASIKFFRTDQGTEYMGSNNFLPCYLNSGIEHLRSAAYSSSSNGIAERMNRTIQDMIRPMLIGSNLPSAFWSYAVENAVRIRNRLPSTVLLNGMSPHEAWFGNVPSVLHFHPFGCYAVPKSLVIKDGEKAEPRGRRCVYLKSRSNSIFVLWDVERNYPIESRDVRFHELKFLAKEEFAKVPHYPKVFTVESDDDERGPIPALVDDGLIPAIASDITKSAAPPQV
jgi:transposase InsO family protein